MSKLHYERSGQSQKTQVGGQLSWLVDPKRGMLLPLSGLWILALDWILFSSNVISAGLATPIVVLLGFCLGGCGVLFLQKWFAKDPLWKAIMKGLLAGIAVGVPWPLTGSLVGGWILLASGMKTSARGSETKA